MMDVIPLKRINAPNRKYTGGIRRCGFFLRNCTKAMAMTKKAAPMARLEPIYIHPSNSVQVPMCHLAGQLSALNNCSKKSTICPIGSLFSLITIWSKKFCLLSQKILKKAPLKYVYDLYR